MQKNKIRVLQFPIANSRGGITNYVLQNWKYIDKSRFQFDFATMSKKLDFEEEILSTNSKIFYISCYAEADEERFTDEFREILRRGSYDIVHLHTKQWKSFLAEKIARQEGIKKIIVHSHSTGIDTLDKEKRGREEILHETVKAELSENVATDYWACSALAADFLYGDKISKNKIKIMKNAIDLSKFIFNSSVRAAYRKELKVGNKIVIGCVGRLVYPKNQEFLLRVMKDICKKTDIFILLLVGNGEKEETHKKYVIENGLSENVIFAGYRKDVPQLLQAMDIFALSSRFEGFPLSVVEAQAAGLKCICSEAITEEILLTDLICRLPLTTAVWKEKILECAATYERRNMEQFMTKAGFDIQNQIKIIESEYARED